MTARELSAEDAIALVRPVDAIGLGLVTSTPAGLLKELSRRDDWQDLTFSGGLILGLYDVFMHPNVHYRASFYGGGERHYQSHGADVQFVPSFFRHYGLLIQHLAPRVMMMQGSMPDSRGNVSLSLYNGAHYEEFLAAGRDPQRLLIVECSPHFPRTLALEGFRNDIAVDDIDVIVYTDERPTVLADETGTPADRRSRTSPPRTWPTARRCRRVSARFRIWSPTPSPSATAVSTGCIRRCSPTGCSNSVRRVRSPTRESPSIVASP